MISKTSPFNARHRQTGVALITALIIMMVLTILGVTVMNMTSLEEKMAFNTQDRSVARYLAESTVILMADRDLLPSPDDPGASSRDFTLPADYLPKLESADGKITFVQNMSWSNLPKSNTRARYMSSGAGGSEDPPAFQLYTTVTTKAGTTSKMRAGYYWQIHRD